MKSVITIKQRVKNKLGKILWDMFSLDKQVENFLSLSALDVAIDTISGNQLEGDYCEFGVYEGASFNHAYNRFKLKNSDDRKFIAFDSFGGLPESSEENKPEQYKKGAYSAGESLFLENVYNNNIPKDKVKVVRGFYNESLDEDAARNVGLEKVAVAYIDCDLYSSTVDVLNFITDYLQRGSVIVIDDWFRHTGTPHDGIQKAVYDWLENNKHIELISLHVYRRVAFIVNIK